MALYTKTFGDFEISIDREIEHLGSGTTRMAVAVRQLSTGRLKWVEYAMSEGESFEQITEDVHESVETSQPFR